MYHLLTLCVYVCTFRDTDSDADFPHLNMIIPIIPVWEVIELYRKSQGSSQKIVTNLHMSRQAIYDLNRAVARLPSGTTPPRKVNQISLKVFKYHTQ